MNTMYDAIQEGKRRYQELPRCYVSEDQAIHFVVSEFIWGKFRENEDMVVDIDTIKVLQDITK